MYKKYFKLISIIAAVLTVGSGIVFRYSVYAQNTTSNIILQCFHDGDIVVTAPSVDDFMIKQTGMFLESRWTNPVTKETEILLTTLPCMYRVTVPGADARLAN